MKLTLFLLCVNVFLAVGNSYSQQTKFTLSGKNVQLEDVLKEIKENSEFRFFYNHNLVDVKKRVSYRVEDATVSEILDQVLDDAGIKYEIVDKTIILSPKEKEAEKPADQPQKKTITGKVNDENGEPLPGVSILVKGTTIGITTDFDGNYSLEIPDDAQVLVFSFVGMKSQEIVIENQASINVSMQEDAIGLEEVVAIGYGTMKKSDLTGAISTVNTEELESVPTASLDNMLSGRVAGMNVRLNSAQPGAGVTVLIRGATSSAGNAPLYVIDGFPVSGENVTPGAGSQFSQGSTNSLNSINPNDIESIEVLKDASATAIYGARAANGVILITTKSGKSGVVDIEYSGNYSVQKANNPFELMNAEELMRARNTISKESWLLDNKIAPYGTTDPGSVNPHVPLYTDSEIAAAGKGTDWFDEVTRLGQIQDHNISLRSGSEKSKYMVSFNYFDHKGIVKNANFSRYSGRLNLDQEIRPWLDLGVRFTGTIIDQENSQMEGRNDNSGVISSAYSFPSFLPVYDEDGNYSMNLNRPNVSNPVSFFEMTDNTKQQRIFLSSWLDIKLTEGLVAKVKYGIDDNQGIRRRYYPKTTLAGQLANGEAAVDQKATVSNLFETTFSYNADLTSGLNLSAMVGYSYQDFLNQTVTANAKDFITDLFLYNSLESGAPDRRELYSGKSYEEYQSFFTRLHFNLKSRYLLTLTMRADGASIFGENNKYGYFPSGSFAWRISEEGFMQDVEAISNLKLRLSYGQAGNANIGGSAFAFYGIEGQYVFGNSIYNSITQTQIENPDLKWETTTEKNLGIDVGLFDNRIFATLELYQRNISDLLSSRLLASYLPISNVADNVGETQSKGVELTLNTINTTGALKWETTLTIGTANDKWVERNPDVTLPVYEKEDGPLHAIYGYKSDGIITSSSEIPAHMPDALPGDIIIQDLNGVDANGNLTGQPDGKISSADIVCLGSTQPNWSFGFSNTFKYHNFDFSFYFYGLMDRINLNQNLRQLHEMTEVWNNNGAKTFLTDVWSSQNPNGTLPTGLRQLYATNSDFYQENASFLRMKNITLGYTFDTKMQNLKNIKQLRVYVDLNNVFVLTDYTNGDPETDSVGSFAAYPFPKTVSVGLNLKF